MNRRSAVATAAFLGVTAVAVGMELVYANDGDPQTLPWTTLAVRYMPSALVLGLVGILVGWLPGHFRHALEAEGKAVPVSDVPMPPAVDQAPAEPLITPATVTSIATLLLGLLVSFGVPLSKEQTGMAITLIGLLATVGLAIWGRSRVFSPASAAKIRIAGRAEGAAGAAGVRRITG